MVGVGEESGAEPGPPDDGLPVDGGPLTGAEPVERKLLMDDSGAPEERGDDDIENRVLDDAGLPPEDTGVVMDAREEDIGLPVGRGTELELPLLKDGPDDG